MNDKQQIEEMANLTHHTEFVDISGYEAEKIAEELLKHYQPKLPEHSVVLEQEDYDNLIEQAEYAERELALKLNQLEDKIVISKKAFNENYVLIDELLIKQDLIELMKKVNSAQEKKIKLLEQEPTQARKETAREIICEIKAFIYDNDNLMERLDIIAKQYGVEVGE